MRDGRRLRGSAKGRKGNKEVEWKEGSIPPWAGKARGRDVYAYVTVFIGGSRDTRPHKARSPRESEVRGRGEVGGAEHESEEARWGGRASM